ncbi:MAG TPA: hypothetical protein VHS76_11155 [Steroidobacteraceae bacterium]|nr:hypothetical protein [Steroidobacteraceae bacterium]
MYTKPTEPRSIGGVLDDGLRLWRAAFVKVWPIALMGQALMAIPLLIFWVQFGTLGVQSMVSMMTGSAGLSLAYALFSLASIGFHNAVIAQTDAIAGSEALTMGQSLSVGFRLLGRAFLLGILIALAIVLPLGLLFFALTGVSTVGRIVIGMVAFVFVCYAAGKVILGAVVLIVEDKGAVDSLRRSWSLTTGYWWRVATILTVLVIVILVLFLVVGFIAGIVAATMGSRSGVSGLLIQVISLLGNTLITPLYAAVLVAIYHDLKLRKEGADLAGRVDALAV